MNPLPSHERAGPYFLKLALIFCFGIAMAYFEAAVVCYLRELHYPEGFALPLKLMPRRIMQIELFRELSTIIMIITVAMVAGRKLWERFGYFIIIFGTWDIFYYVWLKATLDWPSSLMEWDILFLIPMPWIGPVIAPVSISLLMIIGGVSITLLFTRGDDFKLMPASWILWIIATGVILYSFMYDTRAAIGLQQPRPYLYSLLFLGLMLYIIGYFLSYRKVTRP
jgi:hypothetical protein